MYVAYGRSLVEAGNVSRAIPVLSKGLKLSSANDALHKEILALRERALELGGTVTYLSQAIDESRPVLRDDLQQALQEFAAFVAADKRMGFWTRPESKDDYAWITQPEQRAQDLLHTFLKARFQTRISVFEELGTGAGRLDLLLKLDGGLFCCQNELQCAVLGLPAHYAAAQVKSKFAITCKIDHRILVTSLCMMPDWKNIAPR